MLGDGSGRVSRCARQSVTGEGDRKLGHQSSGTGCGALRMAVPRP